ncbi:putative galactinol--sucrose galactosyltransferase 1 [Nymphaea thermarum]|nr:putative galactinol--sucrose galactosyltransferase 1 [Nymphaea thermarum]
MTVGSGVSIVNGNLVVRGTRILTNVHENVTITPAEGTSLTDGAFIGVQSEQIGSRHVFPVGVLQELRFMCTFRFKLWWMTQRMSSYGKDIPFETQFLIIEGPDGSNGGGETENGADKSRVYVVFLPVLEGSFRAVLQGNPDNELEICLESGDPAVDVFEGTNLVFVASGTDPFEVITSAVKSVERHSQTFAHRERKKMPDMLNWFGWCTWDAFYTDVTADGIRQGVESFEKGGIPPRFLIIDDGWQSVGMDVDGVASDGKDAANALFLSHLIFVSTYFVRFRYVYVWHAITGYWGGVRSGVSEMEHYGSKMAYPVASPGVMANEPCEALNSISANGLGMVNPEKVFGFYNELHSYLASAGIDGVKVDVQNILETLGAGHGGRVKLTRQYHQALEASIARNFYDNGIIACMSHNTDGLYSSKRTAVIRASDDFFPRDPVTHTIHVASVAYNTLFLGEFMQPDWDMFHSLHPMAGYHGAARAVGGCAVYVSDKPGNHDFDLLKKLVLPDGSILRAKLPGRPTRDCLFSDPARDGKSLLKIWNLNEHTGVIGELVYVPGNVSVPITLKSREYEVFTIVPVKKLHNRTRFAPIGLIKMFNSGGAIMELLYEPTRSSSVSIKVRGCGHFGAYSSAIPKRITVDSHETAYEYDKNTGMINLVLGIPEKELYLWDMDAVDGAIRGAYTGNQSSVLHMPRSELRRKKLRLSELTTRTRRCFSPAINSPVLVVCPTLNCSASEESSAGWKMMAGIDGNSMVHGTCIFSCVHENITVTPAKVTSLTQGAFICVQSERTGSRHVFLLGVLHSDVGDLLYILFCSLLGIHRELRFMCTFRFKPWWMTHQRMGSYGKDVPCETQFLIVERPDGSNGSGETESGADQCRVYVVFLPVLEGSFRAVLQGNPNDELEICLESGEAPDHVCFAPANKNEPIVVILFCSYQFLNTMSAGSAFRYVYVWQSITGFWGGVRPGVSEMEHYDSKMAYSVASPGVMSNEPCEALNCISANGLGLINPQKVFCFYNELHSYLASAGIDGVKVDVQNILETVGAGRGGRVKLARQYHQALEASIARNYADNGIIGCMSHNTDGLYSSKRTAVRRVSDDFSPRDPVTHTINIASVSYNTPFLGEFMQPELDMFHSLHPMVGYHGAARAVGRCAIFFSDKPAHHDFDLLKKLVLPDGSILRAKLPGRPTKDCLFSDPTRDGKSLLKIWNLNEHTGVIGVFNCQGAGWCRVKKRNQFRDKDPGTLTVTICAKDVQYLFAEKDWGGDLVTYSHIAGELAYIPQNASIPITLKSWEYEVFTIVPVKKLHDGARFAPIGLIKMFNFRGAITELLDEPTIRYSGVSIKVQGCGHFAAYSSAIRKSMTVDSHARAYEYDKNTGMINFVLGIPEKELYLWDVVIDFK